MKWKTTVRRKGHVAVIYDNGLTLFFGPFILTRRRTSPRMATMEAVAIIDSVVTANLDHRKK